MAVLPKLLQPAIVNERISRLNVINTTLQDFFGMRAGGPNVRQSPSRRGSYDVFDDTREVPTATTPGSHAINIARQPVGNVGYTIPRSAEKISLPLEELNQLRALGGPVDSVDSLGERYIADQERIVKQRYTNLREFQIAAMLRGAYTYTQTADYFTHAFSGGGITINYQVPAGNKTQLNMIGGGDIIGTSWDNAAAPIVRDVLEINAAFNQLCGLGLTDIFCTSVVWGYVINNTEVRNLAGSANEPVQSFTRDMDKQEFTAILKACPWVTWHITDNGLNLTGTFTKLIADTAAVFLTKPNQMIAQYWECCEPVVDPVTNRQSNQFGEYYYHKLIDDPVSYEFHARFNGLPIVKIPNAIAYGTVKF